MNLLFIILFLKTNAFANDLGCGQYHLSGIVRKIEDTPLIIVNEHSKSEYRLSVAIEDEPKIVPYVDRAFEMDATILENFDGTKAKLTKLENAKLKVSNPLDSELDTKLTLIKALPCKK